MMMLLATIGEPLASLIDGDLVFLSRLPREVFAGVFLACALVVWLMYRRVAGKVSRNTRWALVGLRAVFLAILLVILAQPAMQKTRSRAGDIFTAVVLDTSQSMSIPDAVVDGKKLARVDAAGRILAGGDGKPGVIARLGENSRVLTFAMDENLRRLKGVADVKATGSYTRVYRSLKELDSETAGLPLGAVVLLTDGKVNRSEADPDAGGTLADAAGILKHRGVPVHVVGLGNPRPPRDFEVVKVFAPRKARRNSQVELFATLRNTDLNRPFEVTVSRGQTVLTTQLVQPKEGVDLQRVRLVITPDVEGSATYTVAIPADPAEVVTANNQQEFSLDISDDRLPVLYIEGSPRLEYRFLRRVMFRDPDFRVVGLLRLAKDRFYVQGASESEQYLQKGFPDTAERLFAFQAVILGDIESSYFTPAQLELLERFVRERGGGVLMLGGVNSLGLGRYAGTPLAKALPVEVTPGDGLYTDERYGAKLTPEGAKHPVLRLNADVEANRLIWENAPQLVGLTPVRGVKAGGQVLLVRDKTNQPVLAVQNYGAGRAGAFMSGGSWYWQMSVPSTEKFQERFWKQLIRWLVVGAKEQLTLSADASVYARREPVTLTATVNGKDLQPANSATVAVAVTDPLGNTQAVRMERVLAQEGVYQCRYIPAEEGNYTVTLKVEDWGGATVSTDPKPTTTPSAPGVDFRVSEPLGEFNDAGLKEAELRTKLAEATGGRYYTIDEVDQLPGEVARHVKMAHEAGIEPQRTPIWDTPLLFGLLLAIGGAEWIVRRRSGLA